MPVAENDFMNGLIRKASPAKLTLDDLETAPSAAVGSREFTIQEPGVEAPDDQFIYEPLPATPGAWAVYPPGIPCETGQYRVSRTTPAGVADFPKMQRALDDAGASSDSFESLPLDEDLEDEEELTGGY